jgi:hypothetical protein
VANLAKIGPPESFFTADCRKKHFFIASPAEAKKRAEIIYQKRFKREAIPGSTMVCLSAIEFKGLAQELANRQEEFNRDKKPLYDSHQKYDVWFRGGDRKRDKQSASNTNSIFKFGVKKNADGLYIMNHVVNA